MIHGSQLLAAARAAGEVLAIVTAGLKIGDVHLSLNRLDNTAEFIYRAKVGENMRGANYAIRFEELCLANSVEGLAFSVLSRFDRESRLPVSGMVGE